MDNVRIAKMAENIVAEAADEDVAMANVDQALDAMVAAVAVIDDNLPNVKTMSVPEQAAMDALKDLMDTALKPYLSDALKTMQIFGK
jgi:predicted RNase H-like HicB family nuclease